MKNLFLKDYLRSTLSVTFFILFACKAIAQQCTYRKFSYYDSKKDKYVLDSLKERLRLPRPSQRDPLETWYLHSLNKTRIEKLRHLFEQDVILKDSTLESYLNNIARKLTTENRGATVFVVNSPYVNGKNMGEGIIFVTTALLARCYNEDQLAFVLSHELAHDELKHVNKKMQRIAQMQKDERAKQQFILIMTDEKLAARYQEAMKSVYEFTYNSRREENEADSLGFILFSKAGYNQGQAIKSLDVIHHGDSLKYDIGIDLLMPLHSDEFPFKDHWLKPRLSVYRGDIAPDEMAQYDSSRTHPAIKKRKELLETHPLFNRAKQSEYTAIPDMDKVWFEVVEVTYKSGQYDRCMFHALQLLHRHPCNSYLITRISGMLLKLASRETPHHINLYVPRYTFGYNSDLRIVNNMLHNMSEKEMAEVVYFMLKNPRYFNEQNRNHYFILEQICKLTYRYDEASALRKKYKETFGESISSGDPASKLEY